MECEHLLLVPDSFPISLNLAHEALAFSFLDLIILVPSLLFEKSANLIDDSNAISFRSTKINKTQCTRARQLTTHITSNSRSIDMVALVSQSLSPTGHHDRSRQGLWAQSVVTLGKHWAKGSTCFVASGK